MQKKYRSTLPSLLLAATTFGALLGSAGAALAQDATPTEEQPQETPASVLQDYVIVVSEGASLLNLPDKNGATLSTASIGQVLRVTGKRRGVGFLPVEVPGGFPVWVHGRNLRVTDTESVFEIVSDAVNQRPLPSGGPESYPLSLRLHSGDLVRVIERKDGTKKLAEDWVRVWSAPGSTGWILGTELKKVRKDGQALWNEAMAELGERTQLGTPIPEAGDVATLNLANREQEAKKAFDTAEALLVTERAKAAPDLAAVRLAYEAVVALDAGARWDRDAKSGLRTVSALEEAVALRGDLENEIVRRNEDLLARQKRHWEESRLRDPLSGRFDARGVLERRSKAGEAHRYILRWGLDEVCEVRCGSGKYDLDMFAGFDIGLKGLLEYGVPGALLDERPVLEVGKIEVIGKR